MTVSIRGNNKTLTVPDNEVVNVLGTGDVIATNGSTISFTGNYGGALTVAGSGNTISLGSAHQTLTLSQSGVTANITALDKDVIKASGDTLNVTVTGDCPTVTLNGSGNTVSLVEGKGATDDVTVVVKGDHNNIVSDSSIDLRVSGFAETITTHGASISLTAASSASIAGSGNTVTANKASISLVSGNTLIVDGDQDQIALNAAGQTLKLSEQDITANITVLNGDVIKANNDTLNVTIGAAIAGNANVGKQASGQSVVTVNGVGNEIALTAAPGASIDTVVVNGDYNTVTKDYFSSGIAGIQVNGDGDVVNASNTNIAVNDASDDCPTVTVIGNFNNITADGTNIELADSSIENIFGSGDTVIADLAVISLMSGNSLTVDGDQTRISLTAAGQELTLAGDDITANITALDGDVINSDCNTLNVTVDGDVIVGNAAFGKSLNGKALVLNGDENTIALSAGVYSSGDTVVINGDCNTINKDYFSSGIAEIDLNGNGDVVNASNTAIVVDDASDDCPTVAITGYFDDITVKGSGASVSVAGFADKITANDTSIKLSVASSATIFGTGNTVIANGALISQMSAGTLTVAGNGDLITLGSEGQTLTVSQGGITANITALGGDVIKASDDTLNMTVGGNGQAVTLKGNDNIVALTVASGGLSDSFVVSGKNNTIVVYGSGETVSTSGSNNVVIGGAGNDTFIGAGGTGKFVGGGGNDIYEFGRGSGQDQIINGTTTNAGPTGELDFAPGISASQLWFQQKGNDLSISILGTKDRITVADWFDSKTSQLQEIKTSDGLEINSGLAKLVQAMASYSAKHPASILLRSRRHQMMRVCRLRLPRIGTPIEVRR